MVIMREIEIREEDINSADAEKLIEELSSELKNITCRDGKSSFNNDDMLNDRAIFVVARDLNGKALGCGALRYFSDEVAEIKRVYAREKSKGTGSKIIKFLEAKARELGYKKLILETGRINKKAVNFYKKHNYQVITGYGKYVNMPESVCFTKFI